MQNIKQFEPGPNASALSIYYRDLGESDFSFLKSVYRSTREGELDRTGWEEWQKADFINMQFFAQHNYYQGHYTDANWLVVEQNNVPIGRLYIEEWPSEYRIIDIALLGEFRTFGIGSAILKDIIDLARSNHKKVGIHVEKDNPAKKLYSRLGFVKSDDTGEVYDLMHWSETVAAG